MSNVQLRLSRAYFKQIHDNPLQYSEETNQDKNLAQLFLKAGSQVSFVDKITTNKWDRAKKEACDSLIKEIKSLKNYCMENIINPEVMLTQIKDFFIQLDAEILHNSIINLEEKRTQLEQILSSKGIPSPRFDIQCVLEYAILLSYRQNEAFDKFRSQYFSCYSNSNHCTGSIKKLTAEIKKIEKMSADEKLSIAIMFSSDNNNQNYVNTDSQVFYKDISFNAEFSMNKFEFARLALNEGAEIKNKEDPDKGAFVRAITYNLVGMLKELISHNVCMNQLSRKEFFAAFHLAIRYGYKEIIEELLKYNNEINVKEAIGELGKNLLHEAIYYDQTEIAKLLINLKKLDIHAVDSNGFTALHWVALRGNLELISILMDAGADAHALNKAEKSSIDLARARGSSEKNFSEAYDLIYFKLQERPRAAVKSTTLPCEIYEFKN